MDFVNCETAKDLLQETSSLVTLPKICLELRKVLADPKHTREQISDIIMFDPSLTTRLLRIVNSSYFGLSSPVNNIPHALGMLGEEDLNNLIIVTSIVKTMNAIKTELDMNQFWKSSIFSAVLARNLTAECLYDLKDEMFIAGLLLNIGKLLMYVNDSELFVEVQQNVLQSEQAEHDIEKKLLGFDHTEIGALLAKTWNFSPLLSDTIANHHELDDSSVTNLIAYCCGYCSDALSFDNLAISDNNEKKEMAVNLPDCSKQLNINEEQLTQILENSLFEYSQAFEAFCGGGS